MDKKLKAGEYVFDSPISMYQVIQKIANGEVSYRKITLPEGLTTQQMLELIEGEKMLSGEITMTVKEGELLPETYTFTRGDSKNSILIEDEKMLSGEITMTVKEGELLPETYTFTRGDSKNSIVLQAKLAMLETINQAWDNKQDELPIKNKKEMLILASIIEKETAIDAERGLVASVFVNRLLKGMKLQTDPTVIYALTNGKTALGRALSRKDLQIDSPFNTYKYYGLPPTPICNPGKASIEAAANPEFSDFLFFVADGKGGHNFASSLKQHNNNVKNWKKNKK